MVAANLHREGESVTGSKHRSSVPIGTITTNIGEEFLLGERVGDGGSGVVYKATSQDEKHEEVAVKFYLIPTQILLMGTTVQSFWAYRDSDKHVYESERTALQKLRHPAIQEVLGWGVISDAAAKFADETAFAVPTGDTVQFLVSRFVKGHTIDKWLADQRRKAQVARSTERHAIRIAVVNCLVDIADALVYLHDECHHQHSDIRIENILIHEASQRPVLIDFGYSQAFGDDAITTSPATRVPPLRLLNAPEALERELHTQRGADGKISRQVLRDLLFPSLDVFQFGRVLQSLFSTHGLGELVAPLDADLLNILTGRLTGWPAGPKTTAREVLEQLSKLRDGYWAGAAAPQAPQLSPGQPVREIALPTGSFLAPALVEKIIETKTYRRLQRFKQLSLLDHVYPGATETRFSHCLSVYSTAVDLVGHLVRSPRFTWLFDGQSTGTLLATALLHDINHFPFLHYCQELDVARDEQLNLFEMFIRGQATNEKPTIGDLLFDAGIDPDQVIRVLSTSYGGLTEPHDQVTKSVIDSGVDVDKIAYVSGDARATGVPFGLGVDRQALMLGADILLQPGRERHWHLCFRPRALSAVESLLFARYWNFKQIYWHHTNRGLGAMVLHVLRTLFNEGHMSFRDFVTEAQSMSELEAVAHLNRIHLEKCGRPSLLDGVVGQRKGLFKRVLSIRTPPLGAPHTADEQRRKAIVDRLGRMSDGERTRVAQACAVKIKEAFSLDHAPLVLLDIPGRPLDDEMNHVFIAELNLDGTIRELIKSPFVATLAGEFLNLSRTIRLFVAPEVRDKIGKPRIAAEAGNLERCLEMCLGSGGKTTTVR
jgi:serine/threonine protein kinase